MNRLSTFIINQEEWSEEMTIEELNEELINACKTGDLDLVKKSIKNGADVFYEDIHENNAIEIAGKNGHIDIVKYLISIGCDPTIFNPYMKKEFDYYIKYKQIFDNCLAEIYGNPVLERTKTEIDISFQEFKKN